MQYIGTKIINAEPMSRAQYNAFRGWSLPADENSEDEGYLVEYLDGGKPNVPTHTGYVSWSPKEQFDAAYIALPFGSESLPPHQQRVVAEKASLDEKRGKLNSFMYGEKFHAVCGEDEQVRLIRQYNAMTDYSGILEARIAAFK